MTNHSSHTLGLTHKQAALMIGIGLLVMLFAAPLAHFHFMSQSVVKGDIAATIVKLQTDGLPYLTGTLLLFITYVMDVLVAWALFWYFQVNNRALAQLVCWTRLTYTALALVGLWSNVAAYDLATSQGPFANIEPGQLQLLVMAQLGAAKSMESFALMFFAVHLAFLSIALWRATHTPSWLSIPMALASFAYFAMHLGKYFSGKGESGWLMFLAMGELVLMVWVLAVGWRRDATDLENNR